VQGIFAKFGIKIDASGNKEAGYTGKWAFAAKNHLI
jgi:hypothetical protein